MICYILAMGKQHPGPHVVVGYGIKIFWSGLFNTSRDHLAVSDSVRMAIHFFINFDTLQMAVSCLLLGLFTPNLGILLSLVYTL